MNTSLPRRECTWCNAALEALWLTAAVLIPLFFNPYSHRIFEADKTALLRSLATLTAVVWAVKLLIRWRAEANDRAHSLHREPKVGEDRRCAIWIGAAAVVFLAVSAASSLTSIMPSISWTGSYERTGGVFTTASCAVIFFSVLFGLRHKEQLDRLLISIILTSTPIALYGILQHFHLDPLQFPAAKVATRCTSTLGNPGFLAGYLIMVIPLTLCRLAAGWKELAGDTVGPDFLRGGLLFLVSTTVMVVAVFLLVLDVSPILTWVLIGSSLALLVAFCSAIPSDRFGAVLYLALPLIFFSFVLALCLLDLFFVARESSYFWASSGAAVFFLLLMAGTARSTGRQPARALGTAAYTLILAVQISCLLFTQSRGPVLALLVSVIFFLIISGLATRKTWISWGTIGLVLCGIALGFFMFQTDSFLVRRAEKTPGLHRFSSYASSPTAQVRKAIWRGTRKLLSAPFPFAYMDAAGKSQPDVRHAWRGLLGYGPETFGLVFPAAHPPELFKIEPGNPDRAHNVFLNELVTRGWLGVLSYLLLFTTALFCGLRRLPCGQPPGGGLFLPFWVLGGLAGAVATWITGNVLLFGLGVPAGLVIGFGVYILTGLVLQTFVRTQPATPRKQTLLVPALVTALLAHFIDIQFGLVVVSTALYFWLFCALMAALALRPELQNTQTGHTGKPSSHARTSARLKQGNVPDSNIPPGRVQTVLHPLGVILLMTLATILFEMLPVPFLTLSKPGLSLAAMGWNEVAPLVLTAATWGLGGILILQHQGASVHSVRPSPGAVLIPPAASLAGALLFAILYSVALRFTAGHPHAWPHIFTFYSGVVFALALLLAFSLSKTYTAEPPTAPLHASQTQKRFSLFCILVFASALLALYLLHLRPIHADIYYRYAMHLEKSGSRERSVPFLEKACAMSPQTSTYLTTLGRTYLELALEHDGRERTAWFAKAEKVLYKVLVENPMDPTHHAALAALYTNRAGLSRGSEQREWYERAWASYDHAVHMKPKDPGLLSVWAQSLLAGGKPDRAEKLLNRSLDSAPSLKGFLTLGEIYLQGEKWSKARDVFSGAVGLAPNAVEAYSGLGYALANMGLLENAVVAYEKAIALAPDIYNDYKNLALVYKELGEPEEAARYLRRALILAPDEKKDALKQALEELMKKGRP